MTPLTLLRFLVGRPSAIREIAANPRSLWIGLVFVISAALAREYDQEDLLREPWYLAIPLVASLLASQAIYFILWWVLGMGWDRLRYWAKYCEFLSLFWMTAPLAWLYAIPYEQFLSHGDALRANLNTLAFVALWRVVLMIQAVRVWLGLDWRVAPIVILCADTMALAAVMFLPWPIIEIMGGIRKPPDDTYILGDVKAIVVMVGVPLFLICLTIAGSCPPKLPESPPEVPPTGKSAWPFFPGRSRRTSAAGAWSAPWLPEK